MHNTLKLTISSAFLGFTFCGCIQKETLHPVTVKEFRQFVDQTNYVTDAEKFGWSFVQQDILNYEMLNDATWQNPFGKTSAKDGSPVTQVSYNDAIAYCKWSNSRLPNYKEYWKLVQQDTRKINISSHGLQLAEQVNIVGNVWDITITENKSGEIRLAGGSYLCSKNTCDGSNPDRKLFVDKTTGNSNIGFSILKNQSNSMR
ncbi:MAG: SUMF1/EgtB/PvdO family nonheme iron enzyme [Bacteroidota bacterium]